MPRRGARCPSCGETLDGKFWLRCTGCRVACCSPATGGACTAFVGGAHYCSAACADACAVEDALQPCPWCKGTGRRPGNGPNIIVACWTCAGTGRAEEKRSTVEGFGSS